MNKYLIYAIGFIAPVLFFARTVIQWWGSEKQNQVISPAIYWQISIAGSVVLLIYGVLRNDFAIVLGQFIVYPIYIRNLQLKNVWLSMKRLTRWIIILLPLVCVSWILLADDYNLHTLLTNSEVSKPLLIWGSVAQVVFTLRFVFQWIYSENQKDSVLPLGFWIFSIIGSLMIISYAVLRLDPVFFLAHILGLFMYTRNIFIHFGKKSIFQMVDSKKNKSN